LKKITKTENLRLAIFRDILHGKYSPGERIPTEREIAEQTRTSRIIVRQAYAELEQAGVLERVQGSGTFVT
jgi:GntR family frlABCD operon transcriptional regulator